MDAERSREGTKIVRKIPASTALISRAWWHLQWLLTLLPSGETYIRSYHLCVVGFGKVGKAFVGLLLRKRQELASRYGIGWRVTGVASRRLGWLAAPEGFTPEKILAGDFSEAEKLPTFANGYAGQSRRAV